MKNPRYGRCMRGCTPGVGDFVDWSCDLHMRLDGDASTQESASSDAAASGSTSMGTIVVLLLAGVAAGGGISFVLFKMRAPDRNPRSKLQDGPDMPAELELAGANGDRHTNDEDL